jgi:serine/threonine protein kinase
VCYLDQYYVRDTKINQSLQDLLVYMLRKKPFERPTIGEIILKLESMLKRDVRSKTPSKRVNTSPEKTKSTSE